MQSRQWLICLECRQQRNYPYDKDASPWAAKPRKPYNTEETMTKPFSVALKQQMVARLTGVNAVSAAQLARETGITQQNLSRWLSEARNSPFAATDDCIVSSWATEQKALIIVHAADLRGDALTAYLQGEGVRPALFRRWRAALEEAGEESVGMTKRLRKLERELARKERALAEAATLLVLREAIGSQAEKEEEVVDEQIEEAGESERSLSPGVDLVDTRTPPSSISDYARRSREPRPAEMRILFGQEFVE
jgi:transposase